MCVSHINLLRSASPNPDEIMRENRNYVRKRKPIGFTMDDLDDERSDDDAFDINFEPKPSTSRVLPSRICKPQNFSQDDTEEDQSVHQDLNNVSKSEENPPEIPRYVLTKIE